MSLGQGKILQAHGEGPGTLPPHLLLLQWEVQSEAASIFSISLSLGRWRCLFLAILNNAVPRTEGSLNPAAATLPACNMKLHFL